VTRPRRAFRLGVTCHSLSTEKSKHIAGTGGTSTRSSSNPRCLVFGELNGGEASFEFLPTIGRKECGDLLDAATVIQ
jgi:hypothetical protein